MINYNPKLGLFPQIFLNYSESCEKFNVMMMSDLEAKSNLLYRFAKIQPDVIFIKDNKD